MTTPTTVALALSSIALTAATATTVDARPHRTKRGPTARPLVRAKPVANVAPVVPLVAASERPVCGNIATKGPSRRECTDLLGTSSYVEREGGWKLLSRRCESADALVVLDPTGRADVTVHPGTRTAESRVVAAGAPSDVPLVAACRQGLP